MSYYNYHACVKQKLFAGELISYYFDASYKKIGFALVLCFCDKTYPIRESHFEEYFEIIGKLYLTICKNNVCYTKFLQGNMAQTDV